MVPLAPLNRSSVAGSNVQADPILPPAKSFENGTGSLVSFSSTGVGSNNDSQNPGGTDPLGGQRRGWVTKNNETEFAEQVQISVGSGMVSMSSDANTDASWSLGWGIGGDLNADLTDAGASNQFVIQIDNNSSVGGSILIGVVTDGGAGNFNRTVDLTASLIPYTMTIPFSSFTGTGNWSDADAITMSVDTVTKGFDTVWSLVGTNGSVPEPASLTLLGLAAMALLRRRAKN
jgi:hypothetical protein